MLKCIFILWMLTLIFHCWMLEMVIYRPSNWDRDCEVHIYSLHLEVLMSMLLQTSACRVARYRHVSASHLLPDKAWPDAQSHHPCGAACRLTCNSWDPTKTNIALRARNQKPHLSRMPGEFIAGLCVWWHKTYRLPFGTVAYFCHTSNWAV